MSLEIFNMVDTPLSIATDLTVIISSIVVTISIIGLLRRKKSKMSKEELDFWQQMHSDMNGYFFDNIVFEYNDENDTKNIKNIKKIKDKYKTDYSQIKKFLIPYIRIALNWTDQKRVIRNINIECGDELICISKLDFFKNCNDDNIKGFDLLSDLIVAIKKYRILQKKSRIKKLLHTIRNYVN